MERVLAEKIHGPAERGFEYIIGAKSLADALKSYEDKPKYQR
jgi:leukotriene-A4 hydrolase